MASLGTMSHSKDTQKKKKKDTQAQQSKSIGNKYECKGGRQTSEMAQGPLPPGVPALVCSPPPGCWQDPVTCF